MALIHVDSKEEFEKEVLGAQGYVLVDFWAAWCGPCKLMKDEIEKISTEYGDTIKVVKVDVDKVKEVAILQKVQGVPTTIFFKDGKELDRTAGYKPATTLKALFESIK